MCTDDFIDLRCLMHGCRRAPRYRYKILCATTDHAPANALRAGLKQLDCFVDYCPSGYLARLLIASDIHYALLILDDLPDETGLALAQFARSVAHRARTPIIIVSPREKPADGAHLVETVKRLLAAGACA
jgi:DNA-binding response OmpR family regulator